jgi:hypothetical protein
MRKPRNLGYREKPLYYQNYVTKMFHIPELTKNNEDFVTSLYFTSELTKLVVHFWHVLKFKVLVLFLHSDIYRRDDPYDPYRRPPPLSVDDPYYDRYRDDPYR